MTQRLQGWRVALGLMSCWAVAACAQQPAAPVTAFVGARLIDGTGRPPVEDATLVVQEGRIVAAGRRSDVQVPRGATVVDLTGQTVIPGLMNAHGHVGDTRGLEAGHYSQDHVLAQLGLYARYGVTTVMSLGGDGEPSVRLRDAQDTSSLDRARLYIAGSIVTAESAESARKMVDENVALGVDIIKIRVDDNLGTSRKMAPEVYRAVIDQAHQRGKRVAAHIFYLADAKDLLRSGADLIAHSVRDDHVDTDLFTLLKQRNVCYVPTLMREVSTFVYASRPAFFEDPFFQREADTGVVRALADPRRQARVRTDRAARAYQRALATAKRNLKALFDAGVRIAMGTDTGPPARFQGYFEHLELEQMVDAGLTPMQALVAATGDAAACLRLPDVGTLERGKWADFVVLQADPLADIRNTRRMESVWIAGNRVPGR
ncbi:MAG: amidohydrolase family protein [Gemmatimonadetes bacterium]|nr:amidohydrolase family protein [Gemmatimonadota bacterium]